MPWHGVTQLCFGFTYALALLLEILQHFYPRRLPAVLGTVCGVIGMIAHSIYLIVHQPTPADPVGSLLVLGWVLALFYVWGLFHTPQRVWAVFVLPVILALVGLATAISMEPRGVDYSPGGILSGERFWGIVHGSLLMGAAVAVGVGFLAGVMYLIQAARLRRKLQPLGGLRLLSLERLEGMNRRALTIAFPLLTVGLLLGALLLGDTEGTPAGWTGLKVLGTVGLWLLSFLLLFLSRGSHLPPRRTAQLTIAAFALLLLTLAAAHPPLASGEMR